MNVPRGTLVFIAIKFRVRNLCRMLMSVNVYLHDKLSSAGCTAGEKTDIWTWTNVHDLQIFNIDLEYYLS